MPPKGSQLLNRVLSRENDDDRCSTSGSEKDMDLGLTHLAATASAGLRMGKLIYPGGTFCSSKNMIASPMLRPRATVNLGKSLSLECCPNFM